MGGVMLFEGGGGMTAGQTGTAASASDPQVQEAVDRTLQYAEMRPESQVVAYQISEVMNDPSLTQEQKDAYIAIMAGLADGVGGAFCIPDGQAEAIRRAFNDIGAAWTDPATPGLRQQVTDSIARNVADGRLDVDEIHALVREPGSAGARELLTGIRDGAVLSGVSDRLLADARREGYDINRYERGPELLTAAADIANMAAANGYTGSAGAVLAEIDRVMHAGPVAGDMTLVQAMMATSLGGLAELPGRDGFHALAGLLNSTAQTASNQEAQDRLFATLVRSGDDSYVGGLDQAGDVSGALDELGVYFEDNMDRLVAEDWRHTNTGHHLDGLVTDFTEKVMLHDGYGRADQTAEAMSDYIAHQAEIIADPDADVSEAEDAARALGTLLGSLELAGERYVDDAGGRAETGLGVLRSVIDLAGTKIASKAGPVGSAAYNATLGAIADGLKDAAVRAAEGDVDDVFGEIVNALQGVRLEINHLDGSILDAFDLRAHDARDPDAERGGPGW
jgi:hypothetical protein